VPQVIEAAILTCGTHPQDGTNAGCVIGSQYILNRAPYSGGYSAWLIAFNSGTSRAAVSAGKGTEGSAAAGHARHRAGRNPPPVHEGDQYLQDC